jgi:iron(III) transport system permease protein
MEKRLTLTAAALALVAIGLLPVLAMIVNTFYVANGFSLEAYETLLASGKQLAPLMRHSLLLSTLVALLATAVGTPLGVLLGRTDLPLRGVFVMLLALPLLLPPYVVAVAWATALYSTGWIGRWFSPATSQILSSTFFGFYGCIGALFTAFMPVVMLLTIAYGEMANPRLEQAGLLTSRWPYVLWRITLPLIAPAILFAAILVFLLTLGEVGVPTFLRYPVYTVEILTQFAAFYDFSAATAAAVPLLFITAAILALEIRFVPTPALELGATRTEESSLPIKLGPWRFPLFGLVTAWTLITVALPVAALIAQAAAPGALVEALSRASDSIYRSAAFATVGATALTILGFLCGYLIHHRALPLWRALDALTLFLFILPGTVIGVGLISLWNRPMTNAVYATPAIIILGLLAQYVVLPTRMTAAVLRRIPPSMEQAAALCGASWFMTLRYIVAPLAKRGLIAAWIIAYVFCLRDLGITMAVYPPGLDTLPVRILTLMANGAPSLISALCVILMMITLAPIFAATLWHARVGQSS